MIFVGCLCCQIFQFIPAHVICRIIYAHLIKDCFVVEQSDTIIVLWDGVNRTISAVEILCKLRIYTHIHAITLDSVCKIHNQICIDIIRNISVHPENIRSGSCWKRCLQFCPVFAGRNLCCNYFNIRILFIKQFDYFIYFICLICIPVIKIDLT